jgi:predicted NodU family carbamoyl transferase
MACHPLAPFNKLWFRLGRVLPPGGQSAGDETSVLLGDHDSAIALVIDGRVAAAQEEHFTRHKHGADFPNNGVEYCVGEGKTTLAEVDAVDFFEKPFPKFERLLETILPSLPAVYSQRARREH